MDTENPSAHRVASRSRIDATRAADEDGTPGIQDERAETEGTGAYRKSGDRLSSFAARRGIHVIENLVTPIPDQSRRPRVGRSVVATPLGIVAANHPLAAAA